MAIQAWESALNAKNEKNVIPNTPVQSGIVKSAVNAVGSGLKATAGTAATIYNAPGNFFSNLQDHLGKIGQNIGQDYMNMTQGVGQNIQNSGSGQQQLGTGALGAASDVATGVFAPINETVGKGVQAGFGALKQFSDYLSNKIIPGSAQAGDNAEAQAQQHITQYAQAHREGMKNLQSLVNIGMAAIGEKAADTTGNLEDIPGKINDTLPQSSSQTSPTSSVTPETPTAQPLPGTNQTGVQDVTPNYKPNMIGQNVMTPDTTDIQGNVVKGKITPRIAEENTNFTGERVPTTSASEHAAGTEVNNIKDYPHGNTGTNLEKGLAVDNAISLEAESMRGKLQVEDKATPLDTEAEKTKIADLVKSHLPKDIQDKIGYIGKDSPLSKVGIKENPQTPLNKALQEAMSSPEDALPKTAAGRYYGKVLEALKEYNGTREGKLDLRQTIDKVYKNARGKLAFGSDSQNALDETNTDIRDDINKDLKSTTQNTDTQASLDKQSKLYTAKDNLYEKARSEAGNKTGRFEQKHPAVKFIKRQLARKAVSVPLTIGATAAGVPLITAAARNLLSGSKTNKGKALK